MANGFNSGSGNLGKVGKAVHDHHTSMMQGFQKVAAPGNPHGTTGGSFLPGQGKPGSVGASVLHGRPGQVAERDDVADLAGQIVRPWANAGPGKGRYRIHRPSAIRSSPRRFSLTAALQCPRLFPLSRAGIRPVVRAALPDATEGVES